MEYLQLQSTCFENIKKLCTNYRKDGADRKTEEYLRKRLSSLDSQWKDFEARHTELLIAVEERNIEYFIENVFEKTEQMVETTRKDIMNRLKEVNDHKTTITFDLTGIDNDSEDQLNYLLNKQKYNFMALERAITKVNLLSCEEKWELEDHLSILKGKWDNIDKLHWEIESKSTSTNESYYTAFTEIEQRYDEMRKILNGKLHSAVHYQKSVPRIEIPEFSGDYKKWISFKDLFLEAIHNNPAINKAQKMQHLKSKLRGEAERIVQHLTISATNYDSCWTLLMQRYDNKHLQFATFMNNMLHLPTISQPDAFNLKRMHDVINESMNGISNIGLDTTTWDPVIVHLMTQKLDSNCHEEYLKSLHSQKEMPNLDDFMYFLEAKFLAYEAKKTARKDVPATQKLSSKFLPTTSAKKPTFEVKQPLPSKIYHTSFGQCPLCNQQHVLMQCPAFIEMDTGRRNQTVSKLQICKNCLFGHGNVACNSTKSCKECNMRHHTLLHYSTLPKKSLTNKGNDATVASSTNSANHLSNNKTEVLLTTVLIKIKSMDGTFIILRALLDQGSQVNLVSENAAQLLRLPRNKIKASVSGVGSSLGDCKGLMKLTCQSIYSDYTFNIEAFIMKKLTNNLPNSSFEMTN